MKIKYIRFLLDYHTSPLWLYDFEGNCEDVLSFKEIENNSDVLKLIEDLSNEHDNLFINTEIEFSFKGFDTLEEMQNFKDRCNLLVKLVREQCGDKYTIENDFDIDNYFAEEEKKLKAENRNQ